MAFEKIVLDKVAKVLDNDNSASFTCGTLFVDCTERQANDIKKALLETLLCDIQITPIGKTGEIAFDFI